MKTAFLLFFTFSSALAWSGIERVLPAAPYGPGSPPDPSSMAPMSLQDSAKTAGAHQRAADEAGSAHERKPSLNEKQLYPPQNRRRSSVTFHLPSPAKPASANRYRQPSSSRQGSQVGNMPAFHQPLRQSREGRAGDRKSGWNRTEASNNLSRARGSSVVHTPPPLLNGARHFGRNPAEVSGSTKLYSRTAGGITGTGMKHKR